MNPPKEFDKEMHKTGPILPYSSLQIYAEAKDFKKALKAIVKTQESDRPVLLRKIGELFKGAKGQPADILVTISVRTAWSLFLQVLNLPKGSEILMTSINIPDMVKIVKEHGLVPVPVDISLDTTAPSMEDIKAVVTPKSKVFVLSYIYGVIYPIDEIVKFCRERGIILVEDISESYRGNNYVGSTDAIMSLFSFGNIKRSTAFAGGMAFVRDKAIYAEMVRIHDSYPILPKKEYFKKVIKAAAMGLLLNNQNINMYSKKIFNAFRINYKELVIKNLRGFNPQASFLDKFKKRPPVATLSFLHYRLASFNQEKFTAAIKKIRQRAVQQLLDKGVKVPGYTMLDDRSFWLFPVVVPDVQLCSDMLNKRGVDAYLGATQLKPIHPTSGSKEPTKMYEFFDKLLYMPISDIVPNEAIDKMVDEIARVVKIVEKRLNSTEPSTKLQDQ